MPLWMQTILALTLVLSCGSWAAWQGVKSLRGKASKIGSCCQKGCGSTAKPTAPQVQFLPSDLLKRR